MTQDQSLSTTRRSQIIEIIRSMYREAVPDGAEPANGAEEKTRLFGSESKLDSFALVNLLLDVEQQIGGKLGVPISLMDERAMSQKNSPFRSVGTLADYIEALIDQENE